MRVVTATLRKTQTSDGLFEMHDDIPLGKQYRVDLDSIKVERYFHTEKKVEHSKEVILDVDDSGTLPTELLYIPGHES